MCHVVIAEYADRPNVTDVPRPRRRVNSDEVGRCESCRNVSAENVRVYDAHISTVSSPRIGAHRHSVELIHVPLTIPNTVHRRTRPDEVRYGYNEHFPGGHRISRVERLIGRVRLMEDRVRRIRGT